MRQITVMLGVITIILVVIFASANEDVTGYLAQNIYGGQSVIVQDEGTAFINDRYTPVIHTGFVYIDSFRINDIIEKNETEYLLLSHSVSGTLGEPDYVFTDTTTINFDLEQDIVLDEWELTYVDSIDTNGDVMYLYQIGNLTVGVSVEEFSIIKSGDSALLLQQSTQNANITVSEIDDPFSIGVGDILMLVSIMVVVGLAGYWLIRRDDWRFIND